MGRIHRMLRVAGGAGDPATSMDAGGACGYGGARSAAMTDPVELTAELIRCPSVTPEEGGAIALARGAARRRRLPDGAGRPGRHRQSLRALGRRRAGARLQRPHRRGAAGRARAAGGTIRSGRWSRTGGSTGAGRPT